jgi:hypothetical protein
VENLAAAFFLLLAIFLYDILFNPEVGAKMFLETFAELPSDYTASFEYFRKYCF